MEALRLTGIFLLKTITDIVMNNTNVQGKSYKVAATQETITAQNSANQGNEYFNGINQEELEGVCEILSKLWSKPGSLQFRPNYFENYLKMADGFVRSARTSADKRNMVLNAIGFLCAALLDTNKSEDEERTEKELWRIENEMRDILNEWVYEDGGTYQHTINPRGPGAYDEDRKQLKRLAREYKSFGEDLPDDILEMIEAADRLTELYRLK